MAPYEGGSSSHDILIDHYTFPRMEPPRSPSEDEEGNVQVALQAIVPRLSKRAWTSFQGGDDTRKQEQQLVTLRSALASIQDRQVIRTPALEGAQEQVLKLIQKCGDELKAALASMTAQCSCHKVIGSDDK